MDQKVEAVDSPAKVVTSLSLTSFQQAKIPSLGMISVLLRESSVLLQNYWLQWEQGNVWFPVAIDTLMAQLLHLQIKVHCKEGTRRY